MKNFLVLSERLGIDLWLRKHNNKIFRATNDAFKNPESQNEVEQFSICGTEFLSNSSKGSFLVRPNIKKFVFFQLEMNRAPSIQRTLNSKKREKIYFLGEREKNFGVRPINKIV